MTLIPDGPIDGEQVTSRQTDSDGNYSFDNITPGDYIVREEVRPGWRQTLPVDGFTQLTNNDNGLDSDQFRTDGVHVVWQGNNDGISDDIFLHTGGRTIKLSDDETNDRDPQLDAGQVVWESSNGDIYFYDGTSVRQFSLPGVFFAQPQISDGQLVWVGYVTAEGRGNYQIFYHDGQGGAFEQITFGQVDNVNPMIDDGKLVWRRGLTDSQVILYDLSSRTEARIDGGAFTNSPPLVEGGTAVWVGYDGNDYEIYRYDGSSTVNLSNNGVKDDKPDLRDGFITWRSFVGPQVELFLYDGTVRQITSNGTFKANPRVSRGRVVWNESDGSDEEIFLYEDGSVRNLSNNSLFEIYPQISGNQVVWWGHDGNDWEIYLATLADSYRLTLSSGQVFTGVDFGNLQPDTLPPTVQAEWVVPDPRNRGVDQLVITFSEPVVGFELGDLRLSRDGDEVLLTAAQTLTSDGGIVWTLSNLAGLTDLAGRYTLELRASHEITDVSGNPLVGDPDFAVTLSGAHVAVRRGNGDSTFRTDAILDTFAGDAGPIAHGDIDGDGVLDLVVGMEGRSEVRVYRGLGAGLFDAPAIYAAGSDILSVKMGDLNGDRRDDIVVVNLFGSVTVLLNNGSGQFPTRTTYSTPDRTKDVVLGDFDRDGGVDLAVSIENVGVKVFYNSNNSGNFSNPANQVTIGARADRGLAAGDIDGDGRLDILAAAQGQRFLSLLYGTAGRSFDVAEIDLSGDSPLAVAIGDVTADGLPDLLYIKPSDQTLRVWKNLGGRAFQSLQTLSTLQSPTDVEVGDFNHDGQPDVLVSTRDDQQRDTLMLYSSAPEGSGLIGAEFISAGIFGSAAGLTVGEFDRSMLLSRFEVETTAPTGTIAAVDPDPRTGAVENILITFSEPVFGFALDDLVLVRDGGTNLLTPSQTLTTSDNVNWVLSNLSSLTGTHGGYVLSLTTAGSGIADRAGNALSMDVSESWAVDTVAPTAYVLDIMPNPRSLAVSDITIVFSEPVTGFDLADLRLTRDGGGNLLTGTQTLNSSDKVSWILGNLSDLTENQGRYVLTLTATGSGIVDASGNTLIDDVANEWRVLLNLAVDSFTVTTSGFTVQFNRPLDASVLNLHGGTPDVTLVGTSTGPVLGSLIVAPDQLSVIFVRTGGLLVPDTYTLTLRSESDAFKSAADGSLLDGDNNGMPGGNNTTTFTVLASSDRVVSVPDIPRGAGQTVNVPANATGLPISISDGAGLTSVTFTLLYDATLLQLNATTPAVVDPSISATVGGTLTTLASSPGSITLRFDAPNGLTLPTGQVRLVNLNATVPSNAPYKAKHVLDLTDISLLAGSSAVPARDNDGVHVAAFLGDFSGDGQIDLTDVIQARRLSIGLSSVVAAQSFKNLDPIILGDASGDSQVDLTDSIQLTRFSLGLPAPLVPTISTQPPAPTPTQDPLIWVPRDLTARPGESLTVPLRFLQSDPAPISFQSFYVVLGYDPAVFDVTTIRLGDIPKGFELMTRIDSQRGLIHVNGAVDGEGVWLSPRTLGNLVLVDVKVKADASIGASAINVMASSQGGNQPVRTLLNSGSLYLGLAPSNANDDVVDGVVTIARRSPIRKTLAAPINPRALDLVLEAEWDLAPRSFSKRMGSVDSEPAPAKVARAESAPAWIASTRYDRRQAIKNKSLGDWSH